LLKGDEFSDQLFGPITSKAINQVNEGSGFNIESKFELNKVQINVMNMENGEIDINQKQLYVVDKDGVPGRDRRIEKIEKFLDEKEGKDVDHLEDLNYMPNKKYNAAETKKLNMRKDQND
jgi:hypothetical protein